MTDIFVYADGNISSQNVLFIKLATEMECFYLFKHNIKMHRNTSPYWVSGGRCGLSFFKTF